SETEADNAGHLQRLCAETGHHVQRVRHEFAGRVVGDSDFPWIVANTEGSELLAAPRQQHVNRNVGTGVARERLSKMRPKSAKGADFPRRVSADSALQGEFR